MPVVGIGVTRGTNLHNLAVIPGQLGSTHCLHKVLSLFLGEAPLFIGDDLIALSTMKILTGWRHRANLGPRGHHHRPGRPRRKLRIDDPQRL